MSDVSVIICSHNPRPDYLARTLASLQAQTLSAAEWELVLVDNNSHERLSDHWDLSWHPRARHVAESQPGLTAARVRGIRESRGDLLVFVDDDNVLAPDYLERGRAIQQMHPTLGAYGAGALEPEFETTPPAHLRPWLSMLALRTVPASQVSSNWTDKQCLPWGAGLCVRRMIANTFAERVGDLNASSLGRRGDDLFCGEDDLFSFLACQEGLAFGIFPELGVTHLIASRRLTEQYILRLIDGHTYSHTVLEYLLSGHIPEAHHLTIVRTLLHGLRRGWFSLRCRLAESRGRARATELIRTEQLRPIAASSTV
jgi:glycosyltransferase involved in cell wall biosynthesis